jgi:hypothetical protein
MIEMFEYKQELQIMRKPKEPKMITMEELGILTTQLDAFVKFYREYILLEDDEHRAALKELECYSDLLNKKAYDQLFLDTRYVEKDEEKQSYL